MESGSAHDSRRQQPPEGRAANIFCLYDQKDVQFYRELQIHLHLLVRQQKIVWLETSAGDDVAPIMLRHLHTAHLILLLLTPDFIAADTLYDAMLVALEERTQRQIFVVPILAKMSAWKETECGDLLALPDDDRPIAHWRQRDEAYEHIRLGLLRLMPHLLQRVSERSPVLPTTTSSPPVRAARLCQPRELPAAYVPRPQVFVALKRSVLKPGGSQTTAITIALRGTGGFGKTTLALALCHDPEVQAAFPDGVFWLELGEHPSDTLTLLNRLLPALGDTQREAITLDEAKARWQQALQDKQCLLAIDDVWQMADLQPLLAGGPRCLRLVTTRNDQVLPDHATRVLVDAMLPQEAMTLLTQGLSDEIQQERYQAVLAELAARLGYWPLLLGFARGILAKQIHHGRSLAQALAVVEQISYGNRGVRLQAGGATNFQERVDVSLQASFRQLEDVVSAHYHPVERYQELAIFPEDTNIPLSVL